MDEASHERLRERLNGAVGISVADDWSEVERLARTVRSPQTRVSPHLRKAALTPRRVLLVIGIAVALAPPALAIGYLVLKSSPTVVRPVTLPTLPAGWTIVADSSQHLRPSGTQVQTLITSWRYRPSTEGPASEIPAGGIMISVALLRSRTYGSGRVDLCDSAPTLSQYPRLSPPLSLPKTTVDTLDAAPHVKEFRIFGRYRHLYDFEVRVDIDTRRPLRPRWSVAETIVHGLDFPKWPAQKAC